MFSGWALLSLLLLPRVGATGVAIAYCTANVAALVVTFAYHHRVLGYRVRPDDARLLAVTLPGFAFAVLLASGDDPIRRVVPLVLVAAWVVWNRRVCLDALASLRGAPDRAFARRAPSLWKHARRPCRGAEPCRAAAHAAHARRRVPAGERARGARAASALGQDQAMARWMAEEPGRRFAERHPDWTVVQLPKLAIGADDCRRPARWRSVADALRGTAHDRPLAGAGGLRERGGDQRAGGPRHAAAIEAACRRISRRFGIRMFSPSIVVLHRIVTGGRTARVEELFGRPLDARERRGPEWRARGHGRRVSCSPSVLISSSPSTSVSGSGSPPFAPLVRLGDALRGVARRLGGDGAHVREAAQSLGGGSAGC